MFLRRRIRALPLLFATLWLALAPIEATAQTKQDVDAKERAVDRAEVIRDDAYSRWIAASNELDAAVAEYELVNGELAELTYRISLLYDRISDYERDVVLLKEQAKSLVLAAYVTGGQQLMSAAFEAGSIQDLLTSQVLINRATARDMQDLGRLEAVRRDMDRLKVDLTGDQNQVAVLEAQAANLVEQLDVLYERREDEYNSADAVVRSRIEALRQAQSRYRAEQVRRAALAAAKARARTSGAAAGLPPEATPGLSCPVRGGASFINSWGFPRSGGRRHKGVDMFAPRGTELVAVTSGTVQLRTVSLGGIASYVYGDDGNLYYYAHLDGYPSGLQSGQSVSKGNVVGYLGSSGNAFSPHLHFEIRPNFGGSVNPYPTVRYYCP